MATIGPIGSGLKMAGKWNYAMKTKGTIGEEFGTKIGTRALLIASAISATLVWMDGKLFNTTPASFEPEFQDAARKIGPVAERTNAPPVFLNPMSNRIPGYIRGPDDLL
jgi:hypothetical protein